jgi:hypothetical protein
MGVCLSFVINSLNKSHYYCLLLNDPNNFETLDNDNNCVVSKEKKTVLKKLKNKILVLFSFKQLSEYDFVND